MDLPLFGLISSTGSSWSSASVGRATATLQKIAPEPGPDRVGFAELPHHVEQKEFPLTHLYGVFLPHLVPSLQTGIMFKPVGAPGT